jgi:hypothetical protein
MSGDAAGRSREATLVNVETEFCSSDEASGSLSFLPVGPMPGRLGATWRIVSNLDDQPREGQVDSWG